MGKFFIMLFLLLNLFFKQAFCQDRVYSITQDSAQLQYVPVPNIKQLIKSGIGVPLFRQSSVSPSWKTVGFNVTIEQKLITGLSFVGSLDANYGFSRYAQLYNLELPLGLRYYFSLGNRMKNRSDRHSFFSHYIGVETHNVVFANLYYDTPNPRVEHYYRGQILDHSTNVGNYSEALNFIQYAYLKVGSQFRVARHNYLDINVSLPIPNLVYTKTEYTLSTPALITIKYGVAW